MARKSRKDLRVEHEIYEKRLAKGEIKETKKKKTKKKKTRKKSTTSRTRRTKDKTAQRRKLMWGVFSGSLKEEARYAYHERKAAEEKLEQLRSKSKKQLYFIQPVKVPLTAAEISGESEESPEEE